MREGKQAFEIQKALEVDDNRIRQVQLAFYALLLIIIVLLVLVFLSLNYADSYDPTKFFLTQNMQFSYAGSPLFMTVFSDDDGYLWCDATGNATISIAGRSIIGISPLGNVTLVAADGSRRDVAGPMTVTTEDAEYVLTVSGLDTAAYNNTHLYFSKANISFEKSGDGFNLLLSSGPGSYKSYDDSFIAVPGGEPLYAFQHFLRVRQGSFRITDSNGTYDFSGDILYAGTISIVAADDMMAYMPVKNTLNLLQADEMTVANTDGSLVIGGKEYECHGADNMYITSDRPSLLSIVKDGRINIIGSAGSMKFRGQEYVREPIKVFLREGSSITMVMSTLAAAFALVCRKLLSWILKR